MDDEELLLRLQEYDTDALDEAVDRYIRLVSAVISGAGEGFLTKQDVEELVEDTFIALWEGSGRIRPGGMKAYLCSTARFRTYDKLRSMHNVTPVSLEELGEDFSVPDGVEEREAAQMIAEAMDELDEGDRRLIMLRYFYCLSSAEIGRQLATSPETIRTRLARARKKLKKYLTERGFAP